MRARAKQFDDFLDRNEGTLKYWLEGIERKPTLAQRLGTNIAAGLVFGTARTADLIFQFSGSSSKSSSTNPPMMLGGGVGGGGGDMFDDDLVTPIRKRPRDGGALFSVRSEVATIPRPVGDLRGGQRIRPILDRSRCASRYGFPGQVSAMFNKIAAGDLNMCSLSHECVGRINSTEQEPPVIGYQGVHTFLHNPLPVSSSYFVSAAAPTVGYITQYLAWQKSLESYSSTVNKRLVNLDSSVNIAINRMSLFMDTTSDLATRHMPTPRTSWDMNTAWQFRDMLCYAYNLFENLTAGKAKLNEDATGAAVRGYLPPGMYHTRNPTTALGSGQAPFAVATAFPNGYPDILDPSLNLLLPWFNYQTAPSTEATGTIASSISAGMSGVGIHRNYSVLYVDHSTISFDILNMETAGVQVDIYELSPRHEVYLSEVKDTTVDANTYANGGWLDPASIWDNYIKEHMTDEVGDSSVVRDVNEATLDYSDDTTNYGEQFVPGIPVAGTTPAVAGVSQRIFANDCRVNRGGLDPRGLGRFYTMRKFRMRLGPGSSQECVIRRDIKRGISYDEMFNSYAGAGVATTYMMVIRGEKGIAYNSTSKLGEMQYGPYNLTVKWRKSSKFCAVPGLNRKTKLDVRMPYRTGYTAIYQYEPQEDEFEGVTTIGSAAKPADT